jgi:hypothetical protein
MDSLPDNDLSPDQAPDAVHDDALELDHVMVVASSTITVVGFADIDTVAGVSVFPSSAFELSEPPPPQADSINASAIGSATEDLKMLDIYTPLIAW